MVAILKEKYERYSQKDLRIFDQMFNCIVEDLEAGYCDFLGDVFQEMEFSNKWKGQFFTPMPVCRMMARMNLSEASERLNAAGYFTCSDPACGAGALLIAVIEELRIQKLNPSTCVYIEAQDIDALACYMCYIQLSLCGVAAKIIHGNSLSMEIWSEYYTPVYFLNDWPRRIAMQKMLDFLRSDKTEMIPNNETKEIEPKPISRGQLLLFE